MATGVEDSMKQRAANSFYRVCSFRSPGKIKLERFSIRGGYYRSYRVAGDGGKGEWDEKFDRFSRVLQRFRDWKLLCIPRRNAGSQVEWILSGP